MIKMMQFGQEKPFKVIPLQEKPSGTQTILFPCELREADRIVVFGTAKQAEAIQKNFSAFISREGLPLWREKSNCIDAYCIKGIKTTKGSEICDSSCDPFYGITITKPQDIVALAALIKEYKIQ